jgi:urease accessory protein
MSEAGEDKEREPAWAAQSLLSLLWLSSPALPIGAYAYSHGLEQAVAREFVTDEGSLVRWVHGVLARQLATLDAPVMVRVRAAALLGDVAGVLRWNQFLHAQRESRELALEDAQLGAALTRLLKERAPGEDWPYPEPLAHASAYGVACARFHVPEQAAVSAFLFAFAENQVTAALKCLLMGQTAGQRVLNALMREIESLTRSVLARPDATLGSFAPGLSLASALHEAQYSRLFRS